MIGIQEGCRLRSVVAVALAATVLGCGSAQHRERGIGDFTPTSSEIERGERVFMANCHQCHPGGKAGLGPGIIDKPLPGFMMKLQVRAGVGAMPGFSAREISAADLDAVVAYIQALRHS